MKNNRLIILLWILTAVLLTSCKKDTPEPASAITFIAGNVELNGMPAAAGMTVKAGDTITTSEKSCAVIQFSQNSLVTMREKTTLEISRLVYAEASSSDQVEIFQKTGITFNKVLRERAGFIVKNAHHYSKRKGHILYC